ncbi:hypothetical protein JI58_04720 [Marinosulfonomonas sp. PRT-SC04]|nr:hypothetical protein JI58_04720 [Marinosulfonomonas sp. PRT-SC04]
MRRGVRNIVRLKHLNKAGHWPSGNPRMYYRPKGEKAIKLPDLPVNSPEFIAAYVSASGGQQPTKKHLTGSIGAAVRAYMASDAYLTMAGSTRSRWSNFLGDIVDKYGKAPIGGLKPKHIRAALADFPAHPANNRLKVWRSLCRWACEAGLIENDPAAAVSPRKTPSTGGHEPWNREDIAVFRTHWPIDTPERLALELLFWTGARISDAVRLGPAMIDKDGWLTFSQTKTGGQVEVPFYAPAPTFSEADEHLKDAINHAPRHLVFMITAFGKPRSVKAASQWFSAAAKKAGIQGKTAHGLRKLRAIVMAENGASPHQIAAWTGHETLAEVQRYTNKANKRRTISGTKSSNSAELVPTFTLKSL